MCLKCCSLPLLPPHAMSSRVCVTVQCLSIGPSVPDALCCRGFAVVGPASRRYQQIAARRSAPAIPQHYSDYYYTRLTASCRTTWVCQYWKAKTSLDLTEARDDGGWDGSGISWTICKQSAPHSRQITAPTPHHSIFTGRMLFLTPNQQCQSTDGKLLYTACSSKCRQRHTVS